MKRIAILGSTGSIGQSALAVVDAHADRVEVVGLAAGSNADLLAAQAARYRPRIVAMATGAAIDRLTAIGLERGVAIGGTGRDGLVAVASHPDADVVLCASSGTDALEAVQRALRAHARDPGKPAVESAWSCRAVSAPSSLLHSVATMHALWSC